MKVLFVGDVHNHMYIFNDIKRLDNEYNFDKIIFVGDYVDDWNTSNHQSLITLDTIFDLKNSNSEKYELLLGNHELSYLGYKCSGHQYDLDDVMEMKLKENINNMKLYTTVICGDNKYYCTHAGITNDYIIDVLGDNWQENLDYMNLEVLNSLGMLRPCSYLRGGQDEYSSFMWADKREHITNNSVKEPIIKYQIIGHSPVKTVEHITPVDNIGNYDFIFIDTHSTYKDGTLFGDKSYLIWDEDKFEIVR